MVKNKKGKKEKIDLEMLARLTQQGFADSKEQFGQHFDKIEEHISTMEEHISTMQEDIKILRADMHVGFEDATHILKPLREDVQNHGAELVEIRERLDRVEKKVGIRK